MKKTKKGCVITAILFAGSALLVLLAYYFFIGPKIMDGKRALATPPTVVVNSPSAGDSSPAGIPLPASVTVMGRNPIARVELWLDGNLYQQQTPSPAAGGSLNIVHANFELVMFDGSHVVVFRAVDNAGLIGQSLSIPVTGTPNPDGNRTKIVNAQAGQTVQDIAQAAGVDPDVVSNLNPGLGTGGLPGGTQVTIPNLSANEEGVPGQSPKGGEVEEPDPLPPENDGVKIVQALQFPVIPADIFSIFLTNRPQAPASLQVGFENCTVQMQWFDNADNETHFNIWMQRVYGPPQLIEATGNNPENGPTRFDFPAPSYGIYSFWVEAANELGAQSSEVREILVANQTCGVGVATYLEIEALDMYVLGPYEKIHCYLSLDGTPAKRIPEGGEHIQVQNSWGDITKYWGGEKKILFPMPADEELSLEGECLSTMGSVAPSLGSFGVSVPRELWNGSRLELKTDSFLVGYRVQPFGPEKAHGTYQYVNYGLAVPQIWSITPQGELQIPEKDFKARTVTLTWHWPGNPDEINSFLILIDGKEFRYVNKLQRQESILLGSACGQKYSFEIIAVGPGGARSVPSTAFQFEQSPCPVMAEVTFLTAKSNITDDQSCVFPLMHTCFSYNRCDEISIWYSLAVNSSGKTEWIKGGTEQSPLTYKCGIEYQFTNQLDANRDSIIVPIDPADPMVRVSTKFWEGDQHDNDSFGTTGRDFPYPYDKWPQVDVDFILTSPFTDGTADMTIRGHIRGFFYPGP